MPCCFYCRTMPGMLFQTQLPPQVSTSCLCDIFYITVMNDLKDCGECTGLLEVGQVTTDSQHTLFRSMLGFRIQTMIYVSCTNFLPVRVYITFFLLSGILTTECDNVAWGGYEWDPNKDITCKSLALDTVCDIKAFHSWLGFKSPLSVPADFKMYRSLHLFKPLAKIHSCTSESAFGAEAFYVALQIVL